MVNIRKLEADLWESADIAPRGADQPVRTHNEQSGRGGQQRHGVGGGPVGNELMEAISKNMKEMGI